CGLSIDPAREPVARRPSAVAAAFVLHEPHWLSRRVRLDRSPTGEPPRRAKRGDSPRVVHWLLCLTRRPVCCPAHCRSWDVRNSDYRSSYFPSRGCPHLTSCRSCFSHLSQRRYSVSRRLSASRSSRLVSRRVSL